MITPADWTAYPNFRPHEFRCPHTGAVLMDAHFLQRLQQLRQLYGAPLQVSHGGGYRAPTHPREAAKPKPGPHATGCAADLLVRGPEAHRLLACALELGFSGIGINQRGYGRFIHLDTLPSRPQGPRPFVWSY